MGLDIQGVLSQNITLVYDSLDLQTIDSSKLKGLIASAKPMVMDTPEMIVAVYPPMPVVIQMGDRRTRITLQQESEEIGAVPLWEIALKCHQFVSQSQLVAYGFNYDVGAAVTDENAQTITMDLFVPNQETIERILDGHLVSFIPRFKFKRGETLYDLILEPLDEKRVKAHLNAHFEGKSLPPKDQLKVSFHQEFGYLISILPRLLEGEEQL
jgi:hypothetical protein